MFETTINNSAKSINKLNANVNTIFYGVNSGTKSIQDIGLFGLLNTLSSIDLCNVINYELNKLSNPNNNSNFDPTKKPDPVSSITSPLNNTIWNIKYAAFSLQQTIDGFNSRNQSSINKNDLTNTAQDVIIQLQSITNANSPESTQNPTIISIFPGIILINNFIENSIGFLSQNPDLRTVPDPVIQKTIQYFDNIRQICLNIQALNSLAALSNSFLNKQLQDDLNSLSKLIDPKKIINYKARSYINKNFVIRRRNSILKLQLGDEFDVRALQVFVHPLFDATIQLWTKMIFPISGFTLKKQDDIEIKG